MQFYPMISSFLQIHVVPDPLFYYPSVGTQASFSPDQPTPVFLQSGCGFGGISESLGGPQPLCHSTTPWPKETRNKI